MTTTEQETTSDKANENLVAGWLQLKDLMEHLDVEVRRNSCENVAAGTRLRKGLRDMRKICTALARLSLTTDSKIKSDRDEKNRASGKPRKVPSFVKKVDPSVPVTPEETPST